jgi:uncharacterized protein YndB with AHSA1/START domain
VEVPELIEQEIVVEAPVERVWTIITEAEHIKAWFAYDGATIDLRPGGALVMRWKEHGTFIARIVTVEPPRRFAYRWTHQADQEPTDGNATLIEFTIQPEGTGTRLRVVESGFRELALPAAEQAQWAADNVEGWSGGFATLQSYLEELALALR